MGDPRRPQKVPLQPFCVGHNNANVTGLIFLFLNFLVCVCVCLYNVYDIYSYSCAGMCVPCTQMPEESIRYPTHSLEVESVTESGASLVVIRP